MTVIDIHTHMLSDAWLKLLEEHGGPRYSVKHGESGPGVILEEGTPFMPMTPAMFDYDLRIRDMDKAGVDVAVLSLTGPNVYWGGEAVSARAAALMNDEMRRAQTAHPGRICYMASLPWQYPEQAIAELERACANGAVGVMVIANIDGRHLTDPHFDPVWAAIDERELPVFVHPISPPGYREMDLGRLNLRATIAFCYDTTLAITRMVMEGFFDRYTKLKIIAAHGGGTIPYLHGRIEKFFQLTAPSREKISISPRKYFEQIYYDAVVYHMAALHACLDLAGPDHVLYGSDYPHQTGDMVQCLAQVNDLPWDQRKRIAGANAQRLFGL